MNNYGKLKEILIKSERQQIFVLFFYMIVAMLLEVVGIGLVIPAVSFMSQKNIVERHPEFQAALNFLGNPNQMQLVVGAMLVLLGIYFFKTLFMMYLSYKQNKFIFGVQAAIANRLFMGYLQQPWSYHLQKNSSQLILNVINEVRLLVDNMLMPMMTVLTDGVALAGIVVFLFVVEPLGAMFVGATLVLAVSIFYQIIKRHVRRWGEIRQHHEKCRLQHLQQGLNGVKEVKLSGREEFFFRYFAQHNKISTSVNQKQKTCIELPRLWIEFLAIVGLTVLVLLSDAQKKSLDDIVPILGLFVAAAFRIMPSLNRLLTSIQSLRYGFPVVVLLANEFQTLKENILKKHDELTSEYKNILTLESVSYRYPNAKQNALSNISITIPYGKSVGFIGTSGAGKSTLVDLILGLLTASEGVIKVDGVGIQSGLRAWQSQIGYVPQSIYLMDDTITKNIAFGIDDAEVDQAALQRSLKAAQLEDLVNSLPEGLNTFVGERGVRLSGGQCQRIGIARALYSDPSVVILDEATSALDNETEKEFMDAVRALHGSKTLIIVAHRLSTLIDCDWVYRLEKGVILDYYSRERFNLEREFAK